MRKLSRFLLKIFVITVVCAVLLYFSFLTILPAILSSHTFLDAVDDVLAKTTGIILTSERFKIKTYPSLVIDVSIDKFKLNCDKDEILNVKNANLSFDIKTFKPKFVNIDYIYLNQKNFHNLVETHKNKKKSKLKLKDIPIINIKKGQVWIYKSELNSVSIDIDNFQIKNVDNEIKCLFQLDIKPSFLKNTIHIGNSGYLFIKDNKLNAKDVEVLIANSKLYVNGLISDSNLKSDFTLKGDDIPVSDVTSTILYIQKHFDSSKKFMENFYDYSGEMDVDLRVTEDGIFGECFVTNLSGKSVLFNVPILFKEVPFTFNGKEFYGGAYGTLGFERVYSDFKVINMMTPNLESKGTVKATLTNKSVGKYVPHASVKENVIASVDWHIKNKKIDVFYNLKIPTGSDIFYKNAYLGLIDRNRALFVQTFKDGEKLFIKNYEYTINDDKTTSKILFGDGAFTRKNGQFSPDYITCKTATDAPISVAGSFYKYLQGGVFNGNLKYDFHKNKITGTFNIKNSIYKHYKIESANVFANENEVKVDAKGFFRKSPFYTNISGVNNFNGKIKINKLYLFLEELYVNINRQPKHPSTFNERIIKNQTNNFDIDLYIIKLNRIKYKRAILTDILVKGSIKNSIFNFDTDNIHFAQGTIGAKGLYDFNNRTSDVVFIANNIDSNIFADSLFNLPDQIQGKANAIIKMNTKNGIKDRQGFIEFSIKQGYLPQLGTTKFMIKNHKFLKKSFTISLQDIVNIDMKNMKTFASDINGSFCIHNNEISNTHITSAHKYFSALILGDYNIESQNTNVQIFGKYNNKEVSKVRILFVPLNFIIRIFFKPEKTMNQYQTILNEVPDVTAPKPEDVNSFRVKIKGENRKNLKLEMKSII